MKIEDIKVGQTYYKIAADGRVHMRKITFIPPMDKKRGKRLLNYQFEYLSYNCQFDYENPVFHSQKTITVTYMQKWLQGSELYVSKEQVLERANSRINLRIASASSRRQLITA